MDTLTLEWQLGGQTHAHAVTATAKAKIGRQKGSDIELPFDTVSRQHALIFKEGAVFYVRNLSQTNQIHINDQVHLAPDQQAPLQPGDVFRVGPVQFRISAPQSKSPPKLKILCSNCKHKVDYNPAGYCPWCGWTLSSGTTVVDADA